MYREREILCMYIYIYIYISYLSIPEGSSSWTGPRLKGGQPAYIV